MPAWRPILGADFCGGGTGSNAFDEDARRRTDKAIMVGQIF